MPPLLDSSIQKSTANNLPRSIPEPDDGDLLHSSAASFAKGRPRLSTPNTMFLSIKQERALAHIMKMSFSIQGSGGDRDAFAVARALICDFKLPETIAFPIMAHWNTKCSPPWSEGELRHKLRSAGRNRHSGHYQVPGDPSKCVQTTSRMGSIGKWSPRGIKPNYALIKEILRISYSLEQLQKNSSVPTSGLTTRDVLPKLFPHDPLVTVGMSKYEFSTQHLSECLPSAHLCSYIVPSACNKKEGYAQGGKLSQHCLDVVGPRQFLVCETDFINRGESGEMLKFAKAEYDLNRDDVAACVLNYLNGMFPSLAITVHSGSKSLHGYFYVSQFTSTDDLDGDKLKGFMTMAVLLGCDPSSWTRSQFARMPQGIRRDDDGNEIALQPILYFNPNNCPPL